MATPKTLVWKRDAHTAAKHDLLRRYLEAWTPILLQRFPRVTYAEGFAGPGIYKGGEPGSPVIALDVFLNRRDLLDAGKRLSMVLVDADRARVEHLRGQLAQTLAAHGRPKPATLDIHAQNGECGDVLQSELAKVAAFGQPIFAVLDSFGGPDIPFDLLKAIASNKSSEVLVTFGTSFLTRFGDVAQHQESGDRAFGGAHWRAVTSQPPHAKKTFLVDAYRETLKTAGFAHSLTFEMIDEAGHALFLIFGTNGPRGLEKMKDAIWKVDPIAGVSYRDPRDEDQTLLDLVAETDKPSLGRMLLAALGDRTMDVEALRQYALFESVYRPEHVIPTVRGLIADGALQTVPSGKGVTRATALRRTGRRPRAATEQAVPQTLFDL